MIAIHSARSLSSLRGLLLLALAMLASTQPTRAITIGQGATIGTDTAGNSYREEFQDWAHADLRYLDATGALDPVNGQYALNDGFDSSRDLVAFYTHADAAANGNYYFRIDLNDLALGAEAGNLNLYLAIDTGSTTATEASYLPDFTDVEVDAGARWHLCIGLYDATNINLYDGAYATGNPALSGMWLGSYWNATLDAVEFGIRKQALYAMGWNGTTPLRFTVGSTKDGVDLTGGGGSTSDLTDAFADPDRGFTDGVINGYITSTDTAGRAKYAAIAHANQSLNQSDDILWHVYDAGVPQKTGFVRTLDTHEIFRVPLNMHFSGSLLNALLWAESPSGPSDPADGPAFLARVARLLDGNQTPVPFSLIGGVQSEHIMPYFEGAANRVSMARFQDMTQAVFGLDESEMQVMHVPERVIRSQATGFSPLTGFTFADIQATNYTATYLDEVTHYHWWFDSANTTWSGLGGNGDAPAQHKIQKIHDIYTFLINDREDRSKFGNHDGGLMLDTRYTLLNKAMQADQAQITVVFDDWEAYAGKSFNISSGSPEANNNQIQYQNTIRWIANKPWVEVVNLKDVLARATDTGNPQFNAAWVIDRGAPTNLGLQTYEYLKWSTQLSYDYWYYNNAGFGLGNEQSLYNLVPVLTGAQGDYAGRGHQATIQAQPAANRDAAAAGFDGPKLPSNKTLGDLNTPGTIFHDAWTDLASAPTNNLRTLGEFAFSHMIYETAWHEEQGPINYDNTTFQNPFPNPEPSWDGVNTWALRLNNNVRGVGHLAYAARWADAVQTLAQGAATQALALDLDQDGQDEYVLRNNKVLGIFDRHGGRLLYAFHYHPSAGPISVIGSPAANPSAPGEEEYTGAAANRCSGLKDMNGGTYADQVYAAAVGMPDASSIRFSSTSGASVIKTITLPSGSARFEVSYTEAVAGDLYVRIGASPNNLSLLKTGRARLTTQYVAGDYYAVRNSDGGDVFVTLSNGATFNPAPADAGFENRNIPLTEEIEVHGNGTFGFWLGFEPAAVPVKLSAWTLE